MYRSEKLTKYALAAGTIASSTGAAKAAIIYDQPGPTLSLAQETDGSDSGSVYISLDGASTTATGNPEEVQFTLNVFTDLTGLGKSLDADVAAGVGIGTTDLSDGTDVDTLPGSAFAGGTLAEVSVYNSDSTDSFSGKVAFRLDADGAGSGTDYYYGWADITAATAESVQDTGSYASLSINALAFNNVLNGPIEIGQAVIPEPGIISLLLITGGGLFLRRRTN